MQHVTIPQDRIGVLIGAGGETLREIEERAEVRLNVDSETGSVEIESVGDPVTGLKGPDIVQAIGRGFKPEAALSLLDDEMRMFDTVDLDAATRNQNDLQRQKGRLIGENGRTRQLMEELSGASVVIYGKTLGVIGAPREVEVVRSATEMILDGAPHGAVYSFLERRHNEMQQEGLGYHRFPGGEGEPDAEADFEIETNPEAVEEADGVSFDEPEP
jgi:ribosomal RNA assembly protein